MKTKKYNINDFTIQNPIYKWIKYFSTVDRQFLFCFFDCMYNLFKEKQSNNEYTKYSLELNNFISFINNVNLKKEDVTVFRDTFKKYIFLAYLVNIKKSDYYDLPSEYNEFDEDTYPFEIYFINFLFKNKKLDTVYFVNFSISFIENILVTFIYILNLLKGKDRSYKIYNLKDKKYGKNISLKKLMKNQNILIYRESSDITLFHLRNY